MVKTIGVRTMVFNGCVYFRKREQRRIDYPSAMKATAPSPALTETQTDALRPHNMTSDFTNGLGTKTKKLLMF